MLFLTWAPNFRGGGVSRRPWPGPSSWSQSTAMDDWL